jgi:N-acetyltransferase
MSWINEPLLRGSYALVRPMTEADAIGLFKIGQDDSIWDWLSYHAFRTPADAEAYVQEALTGKASGGEFPFVIADPESGAIKGTTRYLDIRPAHRALEIGWTWYGVDYQRSGTNTETKLLLLTYAFEALGAVRVCFKTDLRNERSQNAIARLGAVREGVLRQQQIVPKSGHKRDSVYFSIIDSEWPATKERIKSLLK